VHDERTVKSLAVTWDMRDEPLGRTGYHSTVNILGLRSAYLVHKNIKPSEIILRIKEIS